MEKLNYILRSVKIKDPRSKHNGSEKDILIENGIITAIKNKIKYNKHYVEVKIKNLNVCPGFLDLHTRIGEPGYEYREDINSGLNAASRGGFTGIVYMPSTKPVIQNTTDINFLKKKFEGKIIDVFPTGCITKNMDGKEITEMNDMRNEGAISFTDDLNSIENPMVMSIALEYSKDFENPIMVTPYELNLTKNGLINEGVTSSKLGLVGMPKLSEEIRINRDIKLTEYNKGKIHFCHVSTKESFDLIKKSKEKNINVTSDISAYQLILHDEMCESFDSNLKVFPPLRPKKEINHIIRSIKNKTIDAISSNHNPIETESKKCSFAKAKFGIIGLESTFGIVNTVLKNKIEIDEIISLLSIRPRKILNIKCPEIEIGNLANLTLFDPEKKWIYKESDISSKSKNSPFINYEFTGKICGIFNNGQIKINH